MASVVDSYAIMGCGILAIEEKKKPANHRMDLVERLLKEGFEA